MAFGTKYRIRFYDWYDRQCDVLIKYDGYSGGITNIQEYDKEPIRITMSSSNQSKLEWIKGRILELRIIANSFEEYTTDFINYGNKDILCEYLVDSVSTYYGFYVPNTLREAYLPGARVFTVTFNDGLGLLRNEPFMNDDIIYYGKKSLMELIYICLNKTGLIGHIDLWESCIFYEQNHSFADTDSPLTQAYLNAEHFIEDDENITCYEVLERILKSQASRIEQMDGDYHITPLENFKSSFVARKYTNNGTQWVYSTYSTLDNYYEITNGSQPKASTNCFIKSSQIREIIKPYNKFSVKYELQERESINFVHEFKYFDSNVPIGWTDYANYSGSEISNADTNDVTMLNWPADTGINYYDSISVLKNIYLSSNVFDGLKLDFELKIRIKGDIASTDFIWMVSLGSTISPLTHSYLKDDGSWTYLTGSKRNTYNYTNSNISNYMEEFTISINSDKIPFDSYDRLGITLYKPIAGIRFTEIYYESISIGIAEIYENNVQFRKKTITLNTKNIENKEVILNIGDLPEIVNNDLVYFNGIESSTGIPTSLWSKNGESDYKPLHELVCESLVGIYDRNMWQLSGEIQGQFKPASRFIDNNINKIFLINEYDYYVKSAIYFINLLEIDQFDTYLITESTEDILALESAESAKIEI